MATRPISPRTNPDQPNDPAVEEAFAAAPETMIAQIIDGELHVMNRPARPHTRTASVLSMEIGGPFDRGRGGPGGWVILFEPELHLGKRPDKIVPDLAGWRRERLPDARGADDPYFYDVTPDWVCEVLSKSTEVLNRGAKMRIYRREGVRHVWLVNPILFTVEVYRLVDKEWIFVGAHEGNEKVRAEPFDAVELDLAAFWDK